MAFNKNGLKAISQGGQETPDLWMYSTTDTIATVNTEGYFNDVASQLSVNDIIFVASSTGGTPVITITYVSSNAAGVVDVVDGLTVTATDSD